MLIKPDACRQCVGWAWPDKGYVPADGTGNNGVLIVAEAAGEDEQREGVPLVGKIGHGYWQHMLRAGIEREGFRIHNVLSCRPPNNKLAKQPYEESAIASCSPFLDETIREHKEHCLRSGKHCVILTLGQIAFKRVMGITHKNPILKEDYLCYPFWHDTLNCWVVASDHPGYVARGNNHLVGIMQFAAKRALEIAENGLKLEQDEYLLDPAPQTFEQWVTDYLARLAANPELVQSYDIETPYKRKTDEEDLSKDDEEVGDHTILRISFCYEPNRAVSIRWAPEYIPSIERIFKSGGPLVGWNSRIYDDPRVSAKLGIPVQSIDAMVAWHILNSALPKGLGFVTPFYVQNTQMWKHLSETNPAFYSAKDPDMTLRDYLGIVKDLKANNLWNVFDRHVLQLNKPLTYMSGVGVLRDEEMRSNAEVKLTGLLADVERSMEEAVPQEARNLKIYKKTPKDTTGMHEIVQLHGVKYCGVCGVNKPNKKHFDKFHKDIAENPDYIGLDYVKPHVVVLDEPKIVWAKPLEFKVSFKGLTNYQSVLKHRGVVDRKKQKVTFDESAIMKLMLKYPNDKLYPAILEHRHVQKLRNTYIGVTNSAGIVVGGMPIGPDGRIHTIFNFNPSTLRLASQDPNLQNLPRASDDLSAIVRNLIVAAPGHLLMARDYSGIEAVLTGYFAQAPKYIRLAKIDIHSYYTAYALYEQGDPRVKASDLPDISWPDEKLIPHLAGLKKLLKYERNQLYKHLVHAANFGQTASGAQHKIFAETGVEHPLRVIQRVLDIYFGLFPEIPAMHKLLLAQAEKDGYLRNPFSYVHRFNKVYSYTKEGGVWIKKPGDDANKVLAFLAQSTAAGIIKEAILRLFFDRFEEAGQYLRLQVHDELLNEVPEELVDKVDAILRQEMERPVKELPLPPSYGMGEYLVIDTEAKRGARWGSMR